jgi:hypothetical protein
MPRSVITLLVLLSACASTHETVRTVPVEVEREKFVSLAPDLLAPCPAKPDRLVDGITLGTLRSVALEYQNSYVPCLENRLESIRRLQPK